MRDPLSLRDEAIERALCAREAVRAPLTGGEREACVAGVDAALSVTREHAERLERELEALVAEQLERVVWHEDSMRQDALRFGDFVAHAVYDRIAALLGEASATPEPPRDEKGRTPAEARFIQETYGVDGYPVRLPSHDQEQPR